MLPAGGPWRGGGKAADFVFKETRLHCASRAQPSRVPAVNSQQTGSHGRQNPRSASAIQEGLQPPGSKQGWRITARALPRDFHPDLQPPWQRGGEPRPPGKPSPRSECKDRRRGNWELDLPWRSGDRKQGFAIELPSMPALALASVFPSVKEAQ